MSGNRFGTLFQYTTFGESHGTAIGAVVDGVPPRIPLNESDIQKFLDLRKPGQSRHTTQRKEADEIEILSGVFEGQTTGTPIGLLIRNTDQKSKDYSDIKDKFRPGHADFTYNEKYGVRDYRGGGRSSARETAMRVAAGVIARKVLAYDIPRYCHPVGVPEGHSHKRDPEKDSSKAADIMDSRCLSPATQGRRDDGFIKIRACVVQVGTEKIDRAHWDWDQVSQNPFFAPDAEAAEHWATY